MNKPNVLTWSELEPLARDIFKVRAGGDDMLWAKSMWQLIEQTPLAWYHDDKEKTLVTIRLFCIGDFLHHYFDRCDFVPFDPEDHYLNWFDCADLSRFKCIALAGSEFFDDFYMDDDAAFYDVIATQIEQESPSVIKWLTVLTGSNEHLILSLECPEMDVRELLSEDEAYQQCLANLPEVNALLQASLFEWIQNNFELW